MHAPNKLIPLIKVSAYEFVKNGFNTSSTIGPTFKHNDVLHREDAHSFLYENFRSSFEIGNTFFHYVPLIYLDKKLHFSAPNHIISED